VTGLTERLHYINQMQQVMYEDCLCIVTVHPYKLQAYGTDKWDGWRLTGNWGANGPEMAFLTAAIPWAYYNLTPKEAEEETSSLGMWVAIIVAAVVVVGLVVWLVMRRRPAPSMEE